MKNSAIRSVLIGLINPKSPQNVGSVLRAAGCYDADAIYFTGSRYARARAHITDTKNRALTIPVEQRDDLLTGLAKDMKKVAVELVEGATPLPDFSHPENALYLFGPEDGTIPQSLLDRCDEVVYVPTKGCMNLAATVNVLLYDRMAKSSHTRYGDQIIRNNRDTNNKTVVNKK